ncbi:hypothetical protein [Tellurirhabdus bombi]|uniref:hypothetical protein n=1 Tax=Tellurirhabdus bombi TaxID=2907205 RepID=UPI001F2789F1|nr:hypothetical protein [Tellurirhabdus bombi]
MSETNSNTPEVTVESLQAALDTKDQAFQTLQSTVGDKDAEITDLKQQLAQKASVIEESTAHLTIAKEMIDEQAETIKVLEQTLANKEANPSLYPTITVDKKTYEVRASSFKFKYEGIVRDFTIDQLRGDKGLQKAVVKKGLGFLVEVKA